jgi:hypothetical protein
MARRKTKTKPRRPPQLEERLAIFPEKQLEMGAPLSRFAFLQREGFDPSPVILRERLGEGSADRREHKRSSFLVLCHPSLCHSRAKRRIPDPRRSSSSVDSYLAPVRMIRSTPLLIGRVPVAPPALLWERPRPARVRVLLSREMQPPATAGGGEGSANKALQGLKATTFSVPPSLLREGGQGVRFRNRDAAIKVSPYHPPASVTK